MTGRRERSVASRLRREPMGRGLLFRTNAIAAMGTELERDAAIALQHRLARCETTGRPGVRKIRIHTRSSWKLAESALVALGRLHTRKGR